MSADNIIDVKENSAVVKYDSVVVKSVRLNKKTLREIDILQKVSHPNIISVINIRIVDSQIAHITMPYVRQNLLDYVVDRFDAGTVSKKHIRKIFLQLVKAVQYLHSNKIRHGDIKLENVLYDSELDRCYLIDFGFSRIVHGPTKTSSGSIHYVSPEILLRTPHMFESDVWALGVVLHCLLSGGFPENAGIEDICYYGLFINESIKGNRRDLLCKMFAIDPGERIKIQEVQQHPWCRSRRLFEFLRRS